MILKQIILSNPIWLKVNNKVVKEIIERAKTEECFFDDDMWVPSGSIVLGIVNAKKEGEDYRVLLLVATEINSEKQFILSSAILAFGQPWHEKHLIEQQLFGEKENND